MNKLEKIIYQRLFAEKEDTYIKEISRLTSEKTRLKEEKKQLENRLSFLETDFKNSLDDSWFDALTREIEATEIKKDVENLLEKVDKFKNDLRSDEEKRRECLLKKVDELREDLVYE